MSKQYTAAEKLTIARIALGKRFPFYSYLALRLKLKEMAEIPTAGVDGKGTMYYNPEFILGLTTDEIVWLWGHEIGHLIFEHVALKGKRNHTLWNMAGDYAINLILEKDNVGKRIENTLFEDKYEDWTASAIYEDLMKDAKSNMEKYNGDGNANGDDHGMWGELTEEEQQKVGKQWRQAAVAAAHAAKQQGGEVPEGFRHLISDLTETKIRWEDIVRERIRSFNKEEVSWSRVNRRRTLGEFNYPGKKPGEKVEFMVAIDTSGSFSQEDVTKAMSEVYGATREFSEVTVRVIQWDTRVYGDRTFTQENSDEMVNYQIEGGGGTDFNCVINYLRDNHIEPSQLFVFTDLYFSYMGDPGICPTTFIAVGNDAEAPYGETVKYD